MTSDRRTRKGTGGPRGSQLLPLAERTRHLQLLRLGFTMVVLASGVFAQQVVGASLGRLALPTLPYLLLVFGMERLREVRVGRGLKLLGGSLLLDSVYLAWVMYQTGGAASPLRFLIYIQLLGVTLLASYRTGLKIALWHSLLFFIVFYAQAAGVLEPTDATLEQGAPHFRESAVFNVVAFWLVALGTAAFSSLNERELRRRQADLESLATMAAELEDAQDAGAIGSVLLETAREAFGFRRGVVLGAPRGRLVPLARLGPERLSRRGRSPDAVVRRAWERHQAVLVRALDPKADPHLASLLPGARYVAVVPLIADGNPLGALVVENHGRVRSVMERRLLSMLGQVASHGALALRNAWLLEDVQKMAETDPLTGLANRRTFDKVLERELSRARRGGGHLSLVMIDLDHFKAFNDAHGHQAGDEVLRRVGRALLRSARLYDTVARYGGEEFAVILPATTWEDSTSAATRLQVAVSRVSSPSPVTASAGVATFPTGASGAATLIKAADEALYRSKRSGRNRVTRAGRKTLRRDEAAPPPLRAVAAPPSR
jgi:two-component system, cell cycle response regulator